MLKRISMADEFKVYYPLSVSKSRIHGLGAYAKGKIPARKKIGSLAGVIISKRKARQKVKESLSDSIAIVELWNGEALDATGDSNEMKYINHSCGPNTYLRVSGYNVEFYALRDIKPGEELTCNYGPTHHDGKKECKCGSAHCKGFL